MSAIVTFSCLSTTRASTSSFFFFNDTATTEIYTLSLHDALPISRRAAALLPPLRPQSRGRPPRRGARRPDRKSTRLNSSHSSISYAVFCLKKKKTHTSVYHPHRLLPQLLSTSQSFHCLISADSIH